MRADVFLFSKGFAKSRTAAQVLISKGAVLIDQRKVSKPSEEIDDAIEHSVKITETEKYVSRGGLKLEAALDAFKIDVSGKKALDIGASTGGFTDCLLCRGAASVVAVDSGEGQLDARLLSDARVKSIEKYNAKELSPDIVDGKVDAVVMDVSFISQTLIIPGLVSVLKADGVFISLIKPQFEAGRKAVGKGGIVKNAKDRLAAVLRVRDCAEIYGLALVGLIVSPITGGDGNVEYLGCFSFSKEGLDDQQIRRIVL